MSDLSGLAASSRVTLYVLLSLIALFTLLVFWAQIGIINGKPLKNPDGTVDDWREQKIFYGIAWADLVVACPTSVAAIILVFLEPRLGFFILGMVSFWFVWTNVMTTATSLRFAKPRITPMWIVVFPSGIAIGLACIVWIAMHFHTIFG